MVVKKTLLVAFALVLSAFAASACRTDRVIFVQEALDLEGTPRQILKLTESAEADAAYYDGSKWIVVPDVTIPSGWLIVSPKVAEDF